MEAAPPPPVQMMQMLAGFQISQALFVAAKLGLADQLIDGPRSVADIADATGADPRALGRLLRTLASLGVFTESEPGVFAVTPLGRTLASDEPGSVREMALMWMDTHYDPFSRLVDTVRTGVTAADIHYGEPFFDWISQYPDQVGQFTRAMGNLTTGSRPGRSPPTISTGPGRSSTSAAPTAPSWRRSWLALRRRPGWSSTCRTWSPTPEQRSKDMALVTACAPNRVTSSRPSPPGRTRTSCPWSSTTGTTSGPAKFWRTSVAAAKPGATIVALEPVMPAGDEPHMSKTLDLTMLAMTGGLERTAVEHRELFERAGLTFQRIAPTPTPMSFVVATV